ncbi:MAG: hypothetical protein FD156_739 [Nitrospirae bacterium]|nr:MAG: hypothetical protein FD156_739 [Nitrospirota bacterium]
MNRESCIMKNDGFSLVELLIVVAIMGIVFAIAALSMTSMSRTAKLNETRDQLLADIEEAKLKSISGVPQGIFVTGGNSTSYQVLRLTDANSNFKRDAAEVYATLSTVTMPSGMTIEKNNGSEIWFDRKGIPKDSGWAPGNCTFTLTKDGVTRIITISEGGRIQYEY